MNICLLKILNLYSFRFPFPKIHSFHFIRFFFWFQIFCLIHKYDHNSNNLYYLYYFGNIINLHINFVVNLFIFFVLPEIHDIFGHFIVGVLWQNFGTTKKELKNF